MISNETPESSRPTLPSTEPRPLNVKDALTYLDKVKATFASQADVYSRFLDIMKDFKSQMIDTPGVIERVSSLFRGHPTLVSGFNTFLPPGYCIECSVDDQERNVIKVTTPSGTTCITENEALVLSSDSSPVEHPSTKTPVEFNQAITYVNKIKTRFSNRPDTYKKFLEILQTYQKDQKPIEQVYADVKTLFDGSDELLEEFKRFLPDPNKRHKKRMNSMPHLNLSKRTKHHHHHHNEVSDVRSNIDSIQPTFSAEEADFFDQVKTYIGNKATYNAFLKVLNLFSQHIVDQHVLVSRVESFIGGNKHLFDWFKELVGYDGIEEQSLSRPTMQPMHDHDARNCGPSYRHVAKTWQDQPCSGRDALCWDVLNDMYVSHPTWASEDTGFVAAKKNQYEEALHRVEEERYDYDLNIEANLNTIAVLEPIAKKIMAMTPEEKASYRLDPGLGASSPTIYQRIIKKIYGTTKGMEMMDLLHSNPAQAVPIVLKRLRQKDDEWKRAQREWNKIWREVEAKNYWKSLDCQGISFKQNDRKAMATRLLLSQAELQRAQNKPFEYVFEDTGVFKDASRLIYFYLDRQPVYNPEDCDLMREFMNTMIPMLLDVTDVEPSAVDSDIVMEDGVDDDASSVQSTPLTRPLTKAARRRRTTVAGRSAKMGTQEDDTGLLKDVLKRNMNSTRKKHHSDEDEDESDEEDHEEEDEDEDDEDHEEEEDDDEDEEEEEEEGEEDKVRRTHTSDQEEEDNNNNDEEEEEENIRRPRRPRRAAAAAVAAAVIRTKKKKQQRIPKNKKSVPMLASLIDSTHEENQKTYTFYGDNRFYCFFRLYQILYERLSKMKALDAEFKRDPRKSLRAYEEARDLGMTPKRFKALQVNTKRGSYQILLSLIDKLFEGGLDQQTFEECVRYIFGGDAYIMFTIDKLVLSIVRHIHIIITDTQSQELYEIFKHENKAEQMDQGDIGTYQTRVSGVIDATENTFEFVFVSL
ncbi:Transcriptional regulatory protein sin3 [Rhizopus stolonifer]|uniref:Transcriptional regulatory protein sin3 n=1 Tax=Rhizopus stolonifer TaxID=4846 RepID=A0A367JQ24_RHIST|nr:Transcriptional regulatory protein sin3 [Rhizopus stolonifer]